MATWRINNAILLGGEVCAPWQPNHAYSLGARCVCRIAYGTTARRALVFECTTAGTSGAVEPAWPTSGTRTDGPDTLVWTVRNPNDGNWDNASCILHYVLNHSACAAGDSVYVHDAHNETTDMGNNYTIKGSITSNNPVKIFCVDKTDDSLSEGAIVYNSSVTYALTFNNFFYSYGITFKSATNFIVYDPAYNGCHVVLEGSGVTTLLYFADAAPGRVLSVGYGTPQAAAILEIVNGSIFFAANHFLQTLGKSRFIWKGGSVISTGALTHLLNAAVTVNYTLVWNLDFLISGVDLSDVGNGADTAALVDVSNGYIINVLFERCKLPSDAGFSLVKGTWPLKQGRVRYHHCSSENRTYDFHDDCYEGTIEDETTIVRSGGASDGVTPRSNKMISSAKVLDNIHSLESPPITAWTNSITEKTFSVECLIDSATNLQNDDVWMEFEYPVDNSSGLGGFARDKCAMLAAPADKAAGVGSGSWATGGMGNPNSFKCSVTVTPGKPGPITARICVAKANCTIYYDPIITES